jgi:hypothetical protein
MAIPSFQEFVAQRIREQGGLLPPPDPATMGQGVASGAQPGQEAMTNALFNAAYNARFNGANNLPQPDNTLPAGVSLPVMDQPLSAVQITPETAQVMPGEVPNNIFPAISNMPANAPLVANSDLGLPKLPTRAARTADQNAASIASVGGAGGEGLLTRGLAGMLTGDPKIDREILAHFRQTNALPTPGVALPGEQPANFDPIGTASGFFSHGLGKAFALYDKGRQNVQGGEADRLYEYIKVVDQGDYNWAVAHGKIPKNATPDQWKAYQDSVRMAAYGPLDPNRIMDASGNPMGPSGNDPIAKYEAMTPDQQYKYRQEFLNAYENGYYPTRRVEVAPGVFQTERTGEFFKPGSQAGHEYIASQEGVVTRAANDIAQDPFLYALPGTDALGRGVAEIGGKIAAGQSAETVGSLAVKTVGRSLQGAGFALRAPNLFFNAIPEAVIDPAIHGVGDALRGIPGAGFLFKPFKRATAMESGNAVYDGLSAEQDIATGATFNVGGAPTTNIGGIPEPKPGPVMPALETGSLGSTNLDLRSGPFNPGTPDYPTIVQGSGMLGLPEGSRGSSTLDVFPPKTTPYGDIPMGTNSAGTLALPGTSTYPDFEVGPGGEILPRTPSPTKPSDYTGAGTLDTSEAPIRRTNESGTPTTYVGADGNVRVVARGNGAFEVQVKQARGKSTRWIADPNGGFAGVNAEGNALDAAKARVRSGNPSAGVGQLDLTNAPSGPVMPGEAAVTPEPVIPETPAVDVHATGDGAPVYPDYEMPNWLHPDYEPVGTQGAKAAPTIAQTVTYEVGPVEQGAARSFYDQWKSIVDEYATVTTELDKAKYIDDPLLHVPDLPRPGGWMSDEEFNAWRQASNANKTAVRAERLARLPGYETVDKAMEEQRFIGKSNQVWKDTIPADFGQMPVSVRYGDTLIDGARPPVDEFGRFPTTEAVIDTTNGYPLRRVKLTSGPYAGDLMSPVENLTNVIEQAVHGSLDDASDARWFLRALGYTQQADELKAIRKGLYGPESVVPRTQSGRAKVLSDLRGSQGGHWTPAKEGATIPDGVQTRPSPHIEGRTDVWVPSDKRTPKYATATKDLPTQYLHSGPGMPGPNLTGEGPSLPIRPFQPDPNPRIAAAQNDVLNLKWEAGPYEGLDARQVQKINWQEASRDQDLYRTLERDGYNPNKLSASDRKTIKGQVDFNQPQKISVKTTQETPMFGERAPAGRETRFVPPEPKETDGNKLMAALEVKWGRYGDIGETHPYELASGKTAWDRSLSIEPNLSKSLPLAVDLVHALMFRLPRHLLLADPITSWTYTMRNIMSNELMSAIDHPEMYLDGARFKSMKGAFRDSTLDTSVAGEMTSVLTGGGKIPTELRGRVDKLEEVISRGNGTPTKQLMDKLHIGGVGRPFDWKRGLDQQIERSFKVGGYYAPVLKASVAEEIPVFARGMADYAAARGINVTEQEMRDLVWNLRDGNGVFGRDEVYNAFYYQAKGAGLDEVTTRKYAETASRRWTETGRRLVDDTVAKTNRVFPSYLKQTNLDHYLSYITLFHMWPTRAAKFLGEEMIRHPQLAAAWYRAHEGMRRYADEHGYPDSVKGLLYLAASPFGFALFANPSALFMVTQLLPQQNDHPDSKGTTGLGHMLNEIRKKTGLSPVPLVDAVLGLAGVYGDNSMPDVIPSRTVDLTLAALDAALVHTGHDMHDPVWDQTMQNARETFSSMMPWSDGVPAGDATGYAHDLVGSMVLQQNQDLWNRMLAKGPDGRPTEDAAAAQTEYHAIMDNESDPRYVAAEQAVADQGLFTKMLNLGFPLSVSAKELLREGTIDLGHDAKAKGYTGLTPGEQAALDTRGFATDTPAKLALAAEQSASQAAGNDRQNALNDGWNMIAFANFPATDLIYVNGQAYSKALLSSNDFTFANVKGADARKALADAWVSSQGGTAELADFMAERDTIRAGTPEYTAYLDFAKKMRDAPGGIPQARDYLMGISPGYRDYITNLPDATKNNPAKFDSAAISTDAYLASLGKTGSVYGQPGKALDPGAVDPTLYLPWEAGKGTTSSTGSASTYETATRQVETLVKSLGKWQKDMAAFDAEVMKITGGTKYEDLAPMWQGSMDNRLARSGIKKPNKPGIVTSYEDWKTYWNEHYPNEPTGPADYIAWKIANDASTTDTAAAA